MVLDAGDLLFPQVAMTPTPADVARAELLLDAAGAMGTAALGVGDRDLVHGVDWLVERAKRAKVPLLSANLALADGRRPFEAHRLIEAGKARVGVTGIWLANALPAPRGFTAADPVETAKAEAAALRKAGADVVVVLAHGTQAAAEAVAAVEGVDLVIPSHLGMAAQPRQPVPDRGFVLGAGHEGRSLLQIDLALGQPGPLVDASAADRARRELGGLQGAIATAERLLAGAKTAEEKAARARTLDDYRARRDRLKAEAARPVASTANTFHSQQRVLGNGSPESELWAEKVRRFEAQHPAAVTH